MRGYGLAACNAYRCPFRWLIFVNMDPREKAIIILIVAGLAFCFLVWAQVIKIK